MSKIMHNVFVKMSLIIIIKNDQIVQSAKN